MPTDNFVNLVPPLMEQGATEVLYESGRTLCASLSPLDNSIAVYAAPNNKSLAPSTRTNAQDNQIYLASTHTAPASERRLFIIDTSVLFINFRELVKTEQKNDFELLYNDGTLRAMGKITTDYANFSKECWVYASQPHQDEPLQYNADHYQSLYTCFSLFSLLYAPDPDIANVPVGDELMEWLNVHYIEPSTEEGDHLSNQEKPWEDETFWPYLTRTTLRGLSKASVFFLDVLSRHPSPYLQELSEALMPLLESHPRLQNFSTERDFAYASRRWKDKVKSLRIELDVVPEDDRHDGFEDWWSRFSDIVGILEGRGEVIKRICDEAGADWKEVCAAWGIFVDPRLRRQDLPDIVMDILDEMPPDPTDVEDTIHVALFRGQLAEALTHAARLDVWLSAHLADIMEPLGFLDGENDEESGLSLREHYLLSYAEYLHSDPALWRLTVTYMCACGETGKEMADEVLMRVPLKLKSTDDQAVNSAAEKSLRQGDVEGVLKQVVETCREYGREAVRRMVCRIAADTFVKEKEYALALSYCTTAEDWPGLGRILDRVLDEYIVNGPARFTRLVEAMPSLQQIRSIPGAHGVFIHRLTFAVRYSEYHKRLMKQDFQEAALDLVAMFRDDVIPKSWWALLLCDSIELLQYQGAMLFSAPGVCLLLQKLEEIHVRVEQGSVDDYLAILVRTINGGGIKEALQRLKRVRLVLARYFARCAVIGVGGKDGVGFRSMKL